jgi:hypothetical protein
MRLDCRHVFVLDMRPWLRHQRIDRLAGDFLDGWQDSWASGEEAEGFAR